MKIIFDKNGRCAVLTATPKFLSALPESWSAEEKLVYVANKDLATGTKYEIVDSVSDDRTFRNAWEYQSGPNEKISEENEPIEPEEEASEENKPIEPEEEGGE